MLNHVPITDAERECHGMGFVRYCTFLVGVCVLS